MTARSTALTVATVVAMAAGIGFVPGPSARADESCRTVTVAWSSPSPGLYLATGDRETYSTGVVVPTPADGERLTLVTSNWSGFDRYADWTVESRADVDQQHESWGFTVGGVRFGGLTPDLPDTIAEGAETDRYSGLASGGFGSGPIGSGEIVLVHASLDGFRESPNSVRPSELVLVVSYCRDTSDTTTTTTAAATTTTEPSTTTTEPPTPAPAPSESTTTVVESTTTSTAPVPTDPAPPASQTVPPTNGQATTTIVPELATAPTVPTNSTSTTITPAGPTLPTLPTTVPPAISTTVPSRLPETGSEIGGLLQFGGVLIGAGLVLGIVRRRLVL